MNEKLDEITQLKALAEAGALRLSRALEGKIPDELEKKHEQLLSKGVTEEELAKTEYENFIEESLDLPLGRFTAHCQSEITLCLAELLMLRTLEPESAELLEMICPGNGKGVALITAARAAGYTGSIDEAFFEMHEAKKSADFLLCPANNGSGDFYTTVYTADTYLLNLLTSGADADTDDTGYIERFNPGNEEVRIFGMDGEVSSLAGDIETLLKKEGQKPFSVIIEGDKESGRYTLAKAVAEKTGLSLATVDFNRLIVSKKPAFFIKQVLRRTALEGRALCIRDITESSDTIFLINEFMKLCRRHCVLPAFLLAGKKVKPAPFMTEEFLSVRIPESRLIAYELWKGLLPEEYKHMASSLSSKMKLSAGQITRVSSECALKLSAGHILDEGAICRICYDILDDGRYENVKWVNPGFGMEDLKVDDRLKEMLEDICVQVEQRGQVYDSWGLSKSYAYGRCVSVILAGPPGTGKTMAVHALAGRLGLELYKVDLSQIVDKYVGETEKRLEEVFSKAERSNMILFFDEADAVMGKRSEVKDAHDKYANTEISFILQRMEEYDGIVILATNNMQNIDSAFMRRIRYVLYFHLPDADTRREIWTGAFGKGVPLAKDVDLDYLASQFEFSGGEIKNIVLNAVFYASTEKKEVTMKHIMKAVYRELTKGKQVTLSGDYGKYSHMLREDFLFEQ